MKKTKRIIWGSIFIVLGLLYGLSQLELLPFELFFKGWWSLIIILPNLVDLITERNKTASFIALLLGVFLLLAAQGVLAYSLLWKLLFPALLVLLGIHLLRGGLRRKSPPIPVSVSGLPRLVAVFSGREQRYNGQLFEGVEAIAVFGGVDCFAAEAHVCQDCTIRATAVFGGVEVHLPPNVNVKVDGSGLFGGIENHVTRPHIPEAPTVFVRATGVFGGVDIY